MTNVQVSAIKLQAKKAARKQNEKDRDVKFLSYYKADIF